MARIGDLCRPPVFDVAFREKLEQLFLWRRDVRRFRTDQVDNELIEELIATSALAPSVGSCVETNQCVGCTAAVLAPSSGEEPASPRHRAGVASMAWRTTR